MPGQVPNYLEEFMRTRRPSPTPRSQAPRPSTPSTALTGLQLPDMEDPQALSRLSGLTSNIENNPTARLYNLQSQRHDQEKERLVRQTRAGAGIDELRGLEKLFNQTGQDLEANPLTAQAAETDAFMDRQRGAIEQGFRGSAPEEFDGTYWNERTGSPLEQQATAEREAVQYKTDAPVRAQALQNEGILANTGLENKGKIDLQNNFLDSISKLPGGAGPKSMSVPGGGSYSWQTAPRQTRVPANLLNELTTLRHARDAAEQSQAANFAQLDSAYKQQLGNVFGQHQSAPEIQELALAIAHDQNLQGMPLTAIFQQAQNGGLTTSDGVFDVSEITPQEMQQINELVNYVLGGGR